MVPAPFLSEESAKLCTAAGIGYADLAGNARLSFDQVFIETHGVDNPFREKRETRSIISGPRGTVGKEPFGPTRVIIRCGAPRDLLSQPDPFTP